MKEARQTAAPAGPGAARRQPKNLGEGASGAARRLAAAILEVLAGMRTPVEAAQVLEVSLVRYYQLENRALHGMLVACESRSLGRVPTAESALAALQRECDQLRRECGRQQALVRAAQRTIGLAPPPPAAAKPERNGKQRRRRRPMARALRAAQRLQSEATPLPPDPAAVNEVK